MSRPTLIRIHHASLRHNFQVARQLHGGRVLAVIKANAYGHGDVECARTLQDLADGFAVSSLEEALRLRQHGIGGPIVLLEGFFGQAELGEIEAHNLTPVIHQHEQLEWLKQYRPKQPLPLWFKLDSGMHRLGFNSHALRQAVLEVQAAGLAGGITAMTHFANADSPNHSSVMAAVEQFNAAIADLPVETSLCNSGAILGYPTVRGHWGRPGLMLFGQDPAGSALPQRGTLQPVMELTSEVIAIREIEAGESVGYGSLFTAQSRTRVATIACGYADGYPRSALPGTPVAIGNHQASLIGRVSMDMITVDVTHLPQVNVGDKVECWGRNISVSRVAEGAGTVAYELLCNAKRARVEHLRQA
jgi:alanine racemase